MPAPARSLTSPSAHSAMLIRRAAADVFEAFVDPAITSRFWFTIASAPLLKVGQVVSWEWPLGRDLLVDFSFEALAEDATFVNIRQTGFASDADGITEALAATEGFALVLAGAKAWLELGVELRLCPDRFPHATFSHGQPTSKAEQTSDVLETWPTHSSDSDPRLHESSSPARSLMQATNFRAGESE